MRIRTLVTGMVMLAVVASGIAPRAAEDKAIEVLGAARTAIGGKTLESLKTLSVDASLQRNLNNIQLTSEVEILLDLPEKYLRSDVSSGMMSAVMTMGFNGEKAIRPANSGAMAGGGVMIRMGPGGALPSNEKLSPEEQEKVDTQLVRSSRADISRLMLGWFAMTHPALEVQYTYAGEAESPDGKAHVIDAKNADGFQARLFIDEASKLPLMVTYQAPQPRMITQSGPRQHGAAGPRGEQGAVRREMTEEERVQARAEAEKQIKAMQSQPPMLADYSLYFEDWTEVDGLKFPHKIRRAVGGSTNEEWTINKVKVNPKIDSKKFDG